MLAWKFNIHSILIIAGKKLTILARMANIFSFPKMRLLIKSFFESQFAYCPLVWMLFNRTLNNRINKLHERALRILYPIISHIGAAHIKAPALISGPVFQISYFLY